MAEILDCRGIAKRYREKLYSDLKQLSWQPKLATILCTDDMGSKSYSSVIKKDCESLEILLEEYIVSSEIELKSTIDSCNKDKDTNGIFIFYPIKYPSLDNQIIMNLVHPRKDI